MAFKWQDFQPIETAPPTPVAAAPSWDAFTPIEPADDLVTVSPDGGDTYVRVPRSEASRMPVMAQPKSDSYLTTLGERTRDRMLGMGASGLGMIGSIAREGSRDYGIPLGGTVAKLSSIAAKAGVPNAAEISNELNARATDNEFIDSYANKADEWAGRATDAQSDIEKAAQRELGQAKAEGGGEAAEYLLRNPSRIGAMFSDSLPYVAAGGGTAAALKGLGTAVAMTGALTAEGALSSLSAGDQAREEIARMSPEQLAALPEYAALAQQYGEGQARRILAERAGQVGQASGALVNAATLGATRRLSALEEATAGATRQTGAIRAGVTGVGKEAVQEGAQGAGEQLATNVGVSAADPNRTLSQDVLASGIMEAAAGAPGGALSASRPYQAPQQEPTNELGVDDTGLVSAPRGALRARLDAAKVAQATATTPEAKGVADVDAAIAQAELDAPPIAPSAPPVAYFPAATPEMGLVVDVPLSAPPVGNEVDPVDVAPRVADPLPIASIPDANIVQGDANAVPASGLVGNPVAPAESRIAGNVPAAALGGELAPVDAGVGGIGASDVAGRRAESQPYVNDAPAATVAPEVAAALDPEARNVAAHEAELLELAEEGFTPSQLESLRRRRKSVQRDVVTGLWQRSEMVPTFEAAQKAADETGAPSHYVEVDFMNLGGINKALGPSGADPHLRAAAQIIEAAAKDAGGTAQVFRKGGDEFGVVFHGVDGTQVETAMQQARSAMSAYAGAKGLANVPHTKEGKAAGVGLHYGVSEIVPGADIGDIIKRADTLVERRKDGEAYEQQGQIAATGAEPRTAGQVAAGVAAPVSGTGRQNQGAGAGAPAAETGAAAKPVEIDEDTGLPLNDDGTVTLYHHTSASNADGIRKSGSLRSAGEPSVYLTTSQDTGIGYGDTAVAIRVKPSQLMLDDEFPDGRKDFSIDVKRPGGALRVKVEPENPKPKPVSALRRRLDSASQKVAPAPAPERATVTSLRDRLDAKKTRPATSTKNAVAEKERAERGEDAILKAARVSNPETMAKAEKEMTDNPARGRELVERLRTNDVNTVSSVEEGILLREKVIRVKARNDAADRASDPNATDEQKAVAKAEWEAAEADINAIDQATAASGREWGRMGQLRQRLMREDFSFEALERKERVREGRPLTADESQQLREYAARIAKLQDEAEKREAALREAEEKANTQTTYENLVREMVHNLRGGKRKRPTVAYLTAKADAARERLKKTLLGSTTNAGIPPSVFIDLTIVGAEKVAKGFYKLVDWMEAMRGEIVAKFGAAAFNAVRPDLADVYQASKIEAGVKEAEEVEADIKSVSAIVADIEPNNLTHRGVYDLARSHVKNGMRGEDAVMKAVTKDLTAAGIDVTERDVRRLFSEYGKAKFPSKDADKVELRRLRALVQMQESIDRIAEGLDALKSGVQRDKDTLEIREKRRLLNDMLKERERAAGPNEAKLATYQDARARNLRNQIEDIEKQIADGKRAERTPSPALSAENQALATERDTLRKQLDAIAPRKRKPVTDEAYNQRRATALKKQMEALERQLQTGQAPTKGAPPLPSAEVTALRKQRDELKAQIDAITGDEKYQQRRGNQLRKLLQEIQSRMAAGDYEKRVRPPPRELSKANEEAAYALSKAKQEFAIKQFAAEMAKRSPLYKFLGGAADTLNLARAIMTSLDMSAVLRQGGFIALGHPARAARNIMPMLKAFTSEKVAHAVEKEIWDRPNARLYEKAGLDLTRSDSYLPGKAEEAFQSRWLDYMAPVEGEKYKNLLRLVKNASLAVFRGSQRSFTTFLNKMRADSFDAMVASLSRGKEPMLDEAKAVANYINVATGRGKIGFRGKNPGEALSTVFFAPRLVASRFNLLAGQPLYGGTNRTRGMIAMEYARFMTGVSVVYALAVFSSLFMDDDDEKNRPTINFDPRSSDFAKIRFGSTRLDPLAGLGQVTVFLSRVLSGESITAKGDLKPLRDDYRLSRMMEGEFQRPPRPDGKPHNDFGRRDTFGVITQFMRTKFAPVPGAIVNTLTGKNPIGERVTPATAAVELVTPMSFGNIADTMENQGIPRGTAITVLELLGMSVSNYDAPPEKKKVPKDWQWDGYTP